MVRICVMAKSFSLNDHVKAFKETSVMFREFVRYA